MGAIFDSDGSDREGAVDRARELLRRVAEHDSELAWELGLEFDALGETGKELDVRITAIEVENRGLQERLARGSEEFAQLRASMDEFLNLNELSEAISASLNVEDILSSLMSLSSRVVPFDSSGVFAIVEEGQRLEAIALQGEAQEALQRQVRTQWEDGIIDWVLRERRPVVIDDLESSGGADLNAPEKSFFIIPLRVRGKDIGFFALHSPRGKGGFTQAEIEMLGVLANQSAAAIENSRLYSDLETAHGSLQESQRQLLISAKQAAVGELAGGVAHEVNNPLQIILSRVQLMIARYHDDKLVEDLQLIENNVKRISRVIRALLGFSRHTTVAEQQAFDVGSALQQSCALTKHQLDGKLIEVDVRIEQDLPELVGNVGEFEQVFINLILNAENAMSTGGCLTITAGVQPESGELEIRFQDTGIGIAPDHLDRIFEPFFTTRADSGGTGLGLAVSYRIVEQHDGALTVESTLGKGASFIMRFPPSSPASTSASTIELFQQPETTALQ
ncbi:MAG: ATP-binding protein [Candidatus Latescibacterota bacterium]|nr:ATP-binding protein [Candidatus Latescibacterota bacterium]